MTAARNHEQEQTMNRQDMHWTGDAVRITGGNPRWTGLTGHVEHVNKTSSAKVRLDTLPGLTGRLVTVQQDNLEAFSPEAVAEDDPDGTYTEDDQGNWHLVTGTDIGPFPRPGQHEDPLVLVTNYDLLRILDGHELTFLAGNGQLVRVRLYNVDELLAAQRDAAASLSGPDPGMTREAAIELCRPVSLEALARRLRS